MAERDYLAVAHGLVPDALSRDSIDKPLCQRCFSTIEHRREEGQSIQDVGNVVTVGALGGGPTAEEFRKAQLEVFGDPLE